MIFLKLTINGNSVPVKVICPKHGAFYKKPVNLDYDFSACPYCAAELHFSSPETAVYSFLKKMYSNFSVLPQYRIKIDGYLKNKPFDFFIEELNLLIEVDGEQHRTKVFGMTDEDLKKRQEIDRLKEEISQNLGFNFIRLETTDKDMISKLKRKIEELK